MKNDVPLESGWKASCMSGSAFGNTRLSAVGTADGGLPVGGKD